MFKTIKTSIKFSTMRLVNYSLVFILFFLFANCTKDETPAPKPDAEENSNPEPQEPQEPQPEVYFILNVNENVHTEKSDDWIFIHSESGDLLDSKSIESGEFVFEMDSDKIPEKFTITLFHFHTEYSNNYRLTTFTEISKGTYWYWQDLYDFRTWSQGDSYGNFTFKVNDFDNAPINTIISNEFGLIDNSTTFGFINEVWEVSGGPAIYDKDDYISTIMTEAGELKYYIYENVLNQGSFNYFFENPLSYKNDYLNFDNVIQIDLPDNYYLFDLNVMGFQENQEYQRDGFVISSINSAFSTHNFEKVPVGFLNRFDKYIIDFILEWDKGNHTYQNQTYGERPQQIVVPEIPSYTITNNSFQNFSFDTDFKFQWKRDLWGASATPGKSIQWNVYSSSDYNSPFGELPEEFANKYPEINLNSLKHFKSELFFNTLEYSELLDLQYGKVHSTYPHFTHEMMAIISSDE